MPGRGEFPSLFSPRSGTGKIRDSPPTLAGENPQFFWFFLVEMSLAEEMETLPLRHFSAKLSGELLREGCFPAVFLGEGLRKLLKVCVQDLKRRGLGESIASEAKQKWGNGLGDTSTGGIVCTNTERK